MRPSFPKAVTPLAGVTLALIGLFQLPGLAQSPEAPPSASPEVAAGLYTPERMISELNDIERRYVRHVRVESIGRSALGRPLLIARLGARQGPPRPAVFALFGQHPDEHDMNTLGMAFVRGLAERYRHEKATTALLDHYEVVVMPMANPDGVVYDLSEAPKPFEWRRNRRPQAGGIGANLNRNWGGTWKPGTASDWPGEAAFSEPETRAVRDWLCARQRVAGFFDFHSGTSGFNQGMVLLPEPEWMPGVLGDRHRRVATAMAAALALPGDAREGVWALPQSQVRDRLIDAMKRHIPAQHQAGAIASVPADTRVWGTSIGWGPGQGIVTLGLELSRGFNAPDATTYAAALAQDYAARAPRYLDAFISAASMLPAE